MSLEPASYPGRCHDCGSPFAYPDRIAPIDDLCVDHVCELCANEREAK